MEYETHLRLRAELSNRFNQVVISSSQAGQVAGSLQNPAGYKGVFGAGMSLMIGYLSGMSLASAYDSSSRTES